MGFAAGVMIAASIWSLLIPAIERSSNFGKLCWLPAATGFVLGVFIMMALNRYLRKIENKKDMLYLAVTLHNIPEGMAVGVAFASALASQNPLLLAGAFVISSGIAIQNFPEGAIISMPHKAKGLSKLKSFKMGVLSGVVEPIASLITLLLTNIVVLILPFLLSFSAGAMIYVVVEELISECGTKSYYKTIGITLGFTIMMILDVLLG